LNRGFKDFLKRDFVNRTRENEMSEDAERVKKLIAFKKKLETRIVEADSELKELQSALEAVNSILLEKGFRQAKISKETTGAELATPEKAEAAQESEPSFQPKVASENATPLKTVSGELLANLYLTEDSMRVVPAEGRSFDVNTPPFTHFLVERVLVKMQERDSELVRGGQLAPEKIFCYNIVREGDLIREIVVKNADPDRLRELRSSIRWTLEKMLEKTDS
jgi:hypothetical protein